MVMMGDLEASKNDVVSINGVGLTPRYLFWAVQSRKALIFYERGNSSFKLVEMWGMGPKNYKFLEFGRRVD